ncbi:STAS domain-containing protein [Amycolatopsis speibonae]|uniref:STAS domain-containing protein n=1 Tax=Amycolatopsis speibonae TaxID=1450224 RepID=A0ABV7P352_9PSEU
MSPNGSLRSPARASARELDYSRIPMPREGFEETTWQGDAMIVALRGDFDATRKDSLRACLADAIAARPRALLIDATTMTFGSASTFWELLTAHSDAQRDGVPFAVHTAAYAILRPLRTLRLNTSLVVHRRPADARKWLRTAGDGIRWTGIEQV